MAELEVHSRNYEEIVVDGTYFQNIMQINRRGNYEKRIKKKDARQIRKYLN